MKACLLAALLLLPVSASAQDEAPEKPAVAATSADTNADGKVDGEESKALAEADAKASDVVEDVGGLAKAIGDYKDNKANKGTMMALALLLAMIFKMLLSLVKVLAKNTKVFAGKKGKAWLKYSTMALGALVGVCANLAFGVGWLDALILAGSGPLSMVVHEYSSLLPVAGKHSAPDA
jgi:hypothetical protein